MKDISKNQNPTFNQTKFREKNKKRTLEELNMMDSFLFDAATEDAENARKIAKIIIERATGHVVKNLIVETQKSLPYGYCLMTPSGMTACFIPSKIWW